MIAFKDICGRTLSPGDKVVFATTQRPGQSKHAVLKVGVVKYIRKGSSGPYVYVQFVDSEGWVTHALARESEKICAL